MEETIEDVKKEKVFEKQQCKLCGKDPGEDGLCPRCGNCSECCECGGMHK